ncbi:orotidine 5'-phosphate decarboxylase [Nitrososphaera viennensis]|nr:orotidine 5'-phosphate decarboxylase [Nitrososphaera viennensis]UVS67944.1 orotidine 5'-phosphate decarboxylase [Nitrososphaera viennensis]
MAQLAGKKKSRIVVALDPAANKRNLKQFAIRTIDAVAGEACAVKFNFHLLLPLSSREIAEVTKRAHSRRLLCIADIKLNDIGDTNEVALEHLAKMGFDAAIANPFMGANTLASLAKKAHALGMGLIALVYMSHPDAADGYGLQAHGGMMMYRIFLDRAIKAYVDGIVVGATQADILNEISEKKKELKISLPVYSPGVGAQGGDARQAVKSGSDYLIIGRSIFQAKDQAAAARRFRLLAASPSP